jgi:hypothetical protein
LHFSAQPFPQEQSLPELQKSPTELGLPPLAGPKPPAARWRFVSVL